jgi:Kef-type K+ transport system membrane component KefB
MAGVILGPSLLGLIHPNEVLNAVADIGVLLLMFIAGLETDLLQLRRLGKASTWAAAAGVILPLAGGVIVGRAFGLGWATSLFLGAALTATSVSVSVQTLQELGRLRSKEGLITLGAAIIDDVLGILVLSVILAMVGQGSSPLLALARIALFFPIALIGGRLLVGPLVRWIDRHHAKEAGFALIIALVLVYAWAAEAWGGLAAITGAYVAGILVARLPEARAWVTEGASKVGYGLFVPVFFVSVGLATDVRSVMAAPWLSLVVIVVAVATKMFGSGIGARLGGCTWPEARAVGAGMVARGEVALVMATLGISSGLLDQTTFGVVILMTLVTTLFTPFLLKFVLPATSSLAAGDASFAPREAITPVFD